MGERLAARQADLTELEAQRAEKERRKQVFAKALAPEELAAVLVTLREGVSADEVPVARRALKAFVERVVVRGDELRIDYRAEGFTSFRRGAPKGT